jgi:hypothetical protein
MNVDANSPEASAHGVAGERKLILPPRLVEERRRKDAEAEAFFKQCDAYIARWEEERIDQMYNDMIEGYAMHARSWGMLAWTVMIVGPIVLFVKVYVALHGGAP